MVIGKLGIFSSTRNIIMYHFEELTVNINRQYSTRVLFKAWMTFVNSCSGLTSPRRRELDVGFSRRLIEKFIIFSSTRNTNIHQFGALPVPINMFQSLSYVIRSLFDVVQWLFRFNKASSTRTRCCIFSSTDREIQNFPSTRNTITCHFEALPVITNAYYSTRVLFKA